MFLAAQCAGLGYPRTQTQLWRVGQARAAPEPGAISLGFLGEVCVCAQARLHAWVSAALCEGSGSRHRCLPTSRQPERSQADGAAVQTKLRPGGCYFKPGPLASLSWPLHSTSETLWAGRVFGVAAVGMCGESPEVVTCPHTPWLLRRPCRGLSARGWLSFQKVRLAWVLPARGQAGGRHSAWPGLAGSPPPHFKHHVTLGPGTV